MQLSGVRVSDVGASFRVGAKFRVGADVMIGVGLRIVCREQCV